MEFRKQNPFVDLDPLSALDVGSAWKTFAGNLSAAENVLNVDEALAAVARSEPQALLLGHALLFAGREGAGRTRQRSLQPVYRGQDCPDPEFIARALENFFSWLHAESFSEIHPIEQAALVITRIVDLWPFEFGNRAAALVLANHCLRRAGFTPFVVSAKDLQEFDRILGFAISIQMQPLVNAVHSGIRREMLALERQ